MDPQNQAKKILCIEDDHFISELYVRALEHEGFEVETAISGPEGLEKATSGDYDVIIIDIMLPDMLGTDVFPQIKQSTPKSKLVIATNLDLEDEKREKLQSQVDAYVIKADITPGKLVEIVTGLSKK